ncbi:MAG: adenylate/guanylate cyclase domain-containing protein [Candidatus Tectomicrobia bacterium]
MRKLTPFGLSVLLTALLVGTVLFVPYAYTLLHQFELKTEDLRFRLRGARPPSDAVVIVAVDDPSLQRLGRWPWPRSDLARAIERIAAAGARVIGVDFLLSEPSRDETRPLIDLQKRFVDLGLPRLSRNSFRFYRELSASIQAIDHDAALASAIQHAGNVVVATAFLYEVPPESYAVSVDAAAKEALLHGSLLRFRNVDVPQLNPIKQAVAINLPLPQIAQAAQGLAFVNNFPDVDGAIRHEYFVSAYDGEVYPSFDLELVRLWLGIRRDAVELDYLGGIALGDASVIPTDAEGRLLIDFYGGHRRFPVISAADVIEGKVDPEQFRDRVVLLGYMATGLGDVWVAPFGSGLYGIEKHAHVVSNLLQGHYLQSLPRYLRVFPDEKSIEIILMVGWGLVAGFLAAQLLPVPAFGATAVATGLLWVSGVYLFQTQRLWLPLVTPTLGIVLNYIGVTVFRFFTEAKEKARIRGMFSQYVPESVVSQLIAQPQLMQLGGSKAQVTILFSDVEGFTTVSEQLTPEELVILLNEYLTAMTDIVMEHGGIIDKYEGDAIMAEFGVPIWVETHADQAIEAAVAMQQKLVSLREKWGKEGRPQLKARIGINTGDVILGNMGSERVFDYTVMGDAVNLASRLEGANKDYGTYILISQDTQALMSKAIPTRSLGRVVVKGKSVPISIYEVLATHIDHLTPAQQEGYDLYRQGMLFYFERQWIDAVQSFNQALASIPGDMPCMVYIERCQLFKEDPPPNEWTGVYVKEDK